LRPPAAVFRQLTIGGSRRDLSAEMLKSSRLPARREPEISARSSQSRGNRLTMAMRQTANFFVNWYFIVLLSLECETSVDRMGKVWLLL